MSLSERPILTGQEKAKLIEARKKLDNRSLDEQAADKPRKSGVAGDPFETAISNYLLTGEPDDPGKRLDLLSTEEGRIRLIYYPLLDAVMKQEDLQVEAMEIKSGEKGEPNRSAVLSYGIKKSMDDQDIEIAVRPGKGRLSFISRRNIKETQKVDAFDITHRELAWFSLSSDSKNMSAETSAKKDPNLVREEGIFRIIDLSNMFLKAVGETGR